MTPQHRTPAALLLLATLTACGTQTMPGATSSATTVINYSQRGDARIAQCGPGATAEIVIDNRAGAAGRYEIEVAFRGDDGRVLSVGVLIAERVDAGQYATAQVTGPALDGALTCTLERADRT